MTTAKPTAPAAQIEALNPWGALTGRRETAVFREISLAGFPGGGAVEAAGVRLWARRLRFSEALRLQQWVSRTFGGVIGGILGGLASAGGPEGEAQIRADLAAALPLAIEALASEPDWMRLLLALCRGDVGGEPGRGVACYSPAGVRDPAQPGGLLALDEDGLEDAFAAAPIEGLYLLLALVREGVGPLPLLGR